MTTWHVAPVDPSGPSPAKTRIEGIDLLLIRHDDRWWAIEDRCSHAGCAFSDDGEIDAAVAICNCHGSEFDIRTGERIAPPASEPIRTFATQIVGERLEVSM